MSKLRSRITMVVVVLAAAGGYAAGYVPEHARRVAAETQAEALRADLAARHADLDTAHARVRIAALLGQGLMLKDLASRADYGQAQQASSAFFDAVRTEAHATSGATAGAVLSAVLAQRDGVTASLAKADPAVVDTLASIERRLRAALDYPIPAERSESPTATVADP